MNAEDNQTKTSKMLWSIQDHMNTLMLKIYQKHGIGEISMELTGYRGLETNISHNIVVHAGHMDPQVQLLTELILLGKELGLIWLFLLKSSSTVKLEDHAMEAILKKSMSMPIKMVFHKKHAKLTLLRIQPNSAAQIFKNVKIVQALIKMQNVGHKRIIQSGKLLNMALSPELTKWKLNFMQEDLFHVESMQQPN